MVVLRSVADHVRHEQKIRPWNHPLPGEAVMMNLRVTNRALTDGSKVYAVEFTTNDGVNVVLECTYESAAQIVERELEDRVAYSEVRS
jgi:hypothetical protein